MAPLPESSAEKRGCTLFFIIIILSCWAKMSALPPQLFVQRLSLSMPALGLIISSSRIEA